MALYRIHKPLAMGNDKVIPRGSVTALGLPAEKIAKLIEVGAISRVAPPPLAILPGWQTRANRLEPHGITDVEQFMEADAEVIAKLLRVKAATVLSWQQDVVEWMIAKPPTG